MKGAAMKNRMCLIVSLAGGLMLSGGAAFAQDPAAEKTSTPEMVEGQVTKVDMNQGKLTIRASDGTMHVFEASKETLEGYKVGDPIKAKLRAAPQ
jgi:ribosomal protein S1